MLYVESGDFSTSPRKALREIDKDWESYNGLIVFGSHSPKKIDEKLEKIRWARENKVPTLGICLGLHLMVIEYARNVLKLDANSTELDPDTPHPVVSKLPNLRVGMKKASRYPTGEKHLESFWHNYHVNQEYSAKFYPKWGICSTDQVIDLMWLSGHPFFVGTQFHPEYQSSKDNPHHLLVEFLQKCKKST